LLLAVTITAVDIYIYAVKYTGGGKHIIAWMDCWEIEQVKSKNSQKNYSAWGYGLHLVSETKYTSSSRTWTSL
jgi:hypothetical protein